MLTPEQIFDVALLAAPLAFLASALVLGLMAFFPIAAIWLSIRVFGWKGGLLFLALAFLLAYGLRGPIGIVRAIQSWQGILKTPMLLAAEFDVRGVLASTHE